MKKLWVAMLAASCVAAYSLGHQAATASAAPTPASPVALIERAFAATKATVTGFEVHDWTTLPHATMDVAGMEAIGRTVAKALQISPTPSSTAIRANEASVIYAGTQTLAKSSATLQVSAELMSMRFPEAPPQTVLVIRELASARSAQAAGRVYARVAAAVRRIGAAPEINVTLIGLLAKPLDTDARAQVIRRAFTSAGGNPLQGMQDAYTSSVSGYAQKTAAPSLLTGRQNLNLQVALHKRDYQKDTKVLVGSPIITIEY